ncbi:MAG TPA: DUF5313 family protein [Jatrophihabitans sp.]
MSTEIVRPGPVQWLRYAYVGSIAPQHRDWVLHDATAKTWVLRHAARYWAIIGPLVVVAMLALPASWQLRVLSCLTAAMSMMVFYLAYSTESVDRRVEKAGHPSGLAAHMRQERAVAAQRATVARYRERRAARR